MYAYLRGTYRGHPTDSDEVIVVEAAGIGYEVIVPPIVDQELSAQYPLDASCCCTSAPSPAAISRGRCCSAS